MMSERVQAEMPDVVDIFSVGRQEYVTVKAGKRVKVYELAGGYSQTSGATMKRGPVVRRYDPESWGTDAEGKPATFADAAEAEAYCRKWLAPRGAAR